LLLARRSNEAASWTLAEATACAQESGGLPGRGIVKASHARHVE
jgi:hypothetical protein